MNLLHTLIFEFTIKKCKYFGQFDINSNISYDYLLLILHTLFIMHKINNKFTI
jgi:hypothetical protein